MMYATSEAYLAGIVQLLQGVELVLSSIDFTLDRQADAYGGLERSR